MLNHLKVRYARIIIRKNDMLEWFTLTLCVRHEGGLLPEELTVREFEEKCQEAAQLYGNANVETALSDAPSWDAAEAYFNSINLNQ